MLDCKTDFNGDMYLPIMLNSIVHVLVYLHYVLAALGRHSWWSPYLASLQLTQFLVRERETETKRDSDGEVERKK